MPRLSWRGIGRVGACLLLPLPLMVLLWAMLKPDIPAGGPASSPASPLLEPEQRMRLTTYHRRCRTSTECEPPLGCFFDARYKHAYCTDSQCMTDAQCPEDQACRGLATKENGPLVRMCIPVGQRQQGEACAPAPKDKSYACGDGLTCGGLNYNWCGQPCRPGAQAQCPTGFFCADTVPAPLCLPSCEQRGCPDGQQCVRFEEGASVCAQVHGVNCQQSTCAEDRTCLALTSPPKPGEVWMECIERCGNGLPSCSPGKVCDVWQCLQGCDPQASDVCAEGYRCGQPGPERPFACRPDR